MITATRGLTLGPNPGRVMVTRRKGRTVAYEMLIVETTDNGVVVITMNDPESLNAMGGVWLVQSSRGFTPSYQR